MVSLTKRRGDKGEKIARDYLENYGFTFVQSNYRSKYGEIDAIFKDKDHIVFIETKTRKFGTKMSGIEAVNYRKKEKIIKTACVYFQEAGLDMQPRFDVVEVLMDRDDKPKIINYIKNAFNMEVDYAPF